MPTKYYFYKKKEEYFAEFHMKKRITLTKFGMYICGVAGYVFLFIIVFRITWVLIHGEKETLETFSWWFWLGGSLFLTFILLFLSYASYKALKDIKNSANIFVTDEGINLPFPYGKNSQNTFMPFSNISKIVVINYTSTPLIYEIDIFYKKKIKVEFGIKSDRYGLFLKKKDVEKFINAIKLATKNKIPIEYKTDVYVFGYREV